MTDQARELHLKGVDLFREGRFKAARAALTAAYRIKPHHQIAGALGACEVKLGRHRDAAQHLHHFLRELPKSAPDSERKATAKLFRVAASHVGRVDVTVDETVDRSAVDFELDGKSLSLANDGVLFVAPGEHTIEARSAGYQTTRLTVTAVAGGRQKLSISFEPFVAAEDAASDDAASGGPSTAVLGVGLGLGLATVGAAIGLTLAANGKVSDIDGLAAQIGGDNSACLGSGAPAACADLQSAADGRQTLTGAAIGSWVVGGALLVGTGIYYFVAPDTPSEQRSGAIIVPIIAPGRGGVALIGRF
jgi:hypothetical protein